MPTDRRTIENHVNGLAYGGKVLSMTPAPEGWYVYTEERETKKGEEPVVTETWHLLIAWGLVEAMYRDGDVRTATEPLFLHNGRVMHTAEFRWMYGAGETDEGGWRHTVSVDVVPPKELRDELARLKQLHTTRTESAPAERKSGTQDHDDMSPAADVAALGVAED